MYLIRDNWVIKLQQIHCMDKQAPEQVHFMTLILLHQQQLQAENFCYTPKQLLKRHMVTLYVTPNMVRFVVMQNGFMVTQILYLQHLMLLCCDQSF